MTVPELLEVLKDVDFNVILLYKVREAFHKFGIDPAPGFIQPAKHIEYHIRVLRALSNVGPDAVPDLIEALEDENKWIRNLATITLGHIGPKAKEAVPALIDALEDDEFFVREHAAGALHLIDPMTYPEGKAGKLPGIFDGPIILVHPLNPR